MVWPGPPPPRWEQADQGGTPQSYQAAPELSSRRGWSRAGLRGKGRGGDQDLIPQRPSLPFRTRLSHYLTFRSSTLIKSACWCCSPRGRLCILRKRSPGHRFLPAGSRGGSCPSTQPGGRRSRADPAGATSPPPCLHSRGGARPGPNPVSANCWLGDRGQDTQSPPTSLPASVEWEFMITPPSERGTAAGSLTFNRQV